MEEVNICDIMVGELLGPGAIPLEGRENRRESCHCCLIDPEGPNEPGNRMCTTKGAIGTLKDSEEREWCSEIIIVPDGRCGRARNLREAAARCKEAHPKDTRSFFECYAPEFSKIAHHTNPKAKEGTCYEDAWRFLMKERQGKLIHGSVTGADGKTVKHAWVELPTGYIWEPETKSFFKKSTFEKTFKPTEDAAYTVEEAAITAIKKGYHGAWASVPNPGIAKEPWQMTLKEWLTYSEKETRKAGFEWLADSAQRMEKQHEKQVKAAHYAGLLVPAEVLKDYPDLVKAIPKAEVGMPEVTIEEGTLLHHLALASQRESAEGYLRKRFGDEMLDKLHKERFIGREPKGIYYITLRGREVAGKIPPKGG